MSSRNRKDIHVWNQKGINILLSGDVIICKWLASHLFSCNSFVSCKCQVVCFEADNIVIYCTCFTYVCQQKVRPPSTWGMVCGRWFVSYSDVINMLLTTCVKGTWVHSWRKNHNDLSSQLTITQPCSWSSTKWNPAFSLQHTTPHTAGSLWDTYRLSPGQHGHSIYSILYQLWRPTALTFDLYVWPWPTEDILRDNNISKPCFSLLISNDSG